MSHTFRHALRARSRAVGFLFASGLALGAPLGVWAVTPALSGGDTHSLALRRDGTVRAWGSDNDGQLGNGRTVFSRVAVRSVGLPGNIASVFAIDTYASAAVTSDGALWTWGEGPLGNLDDFSTPRRFPELTDVAGVTTGGLVLKKDGTVWSVSSTQIVQGDQRVLRRSVVQVPNIAGVAAIVDGLALKTDGTVWQLASGQFAYAPVPGLSSVTAVAQGHGFSLALKLDGTVWAWGKNNLGQLGNGTTIDSATPVQVPGLSDITAISAHGIFNSAYAVARDGTLWAWGPDVNDLGLGAAAATAVTPIRPTRVALPAPAASIAMGPGYALALTRDGRLWGWGACAVVPCATGTLLAFSPLEITSPKNVVGLSAGFEAALLRTADGAVYGLGSDLHGQFGDGQPINVPTPAAVADLSRVVSMSAIFTANLAVLDDGTLWTWGFESSGGFLTSVPRQLTAISNVAAVSGPALLLRDGTAGLITNVPIGLFTPAPGLNGVVAVAASPSAGGSLFALALKADGSVWAWGSNRDFGLGVGASVTQSDVPLQVPGLPKIASIAVGPSMAAAIDTTGAVWTWGQNESGQLGDGTTLSRPIPTRIGGLSNASRIALGSSHAVAATTDGHLWSWGSNASGKLGDGTRTNRLSPGPVADAPDGFVDVAATPIASLALRSDGTVWSWGGNYNGQLGDGTFAVRSKPVVVLHEGGSGSLATNDWFLTVDSSQPATIPATAIPTFLAKASGSTTSASLDISASIKFRASDVGSPIHVFAYAPASLVKRLDRTKDGDVCAIAQLGPDNQLHPVSADQLQAYLSGVEGIQGQTVSILNGVPGPNVAGATFCVGAGATGTQSADPRNNQCVATLPGSQLCLPPAGTATVASDPPGALSGLWWNPDESGWGISLTQRRNVLFVAWYAYDGAGKPTWYVSSSCAMPPGNSGGIGTCTGQLSQVTGPAFFGTTFNPAIENIQPAGSLQVTFRDASNGSFTYGVGGVSRTVPITRQLFGTPGTDPPVNYTDLWWNPQESGWGISITHRFDVMFLAWFVYDGAGKPTWYVASSCAVNASGCTGRLFRTVGPPFGASFDPKQVHGTDVGSMSVVFTDPNNGTLSYTVDGVSAMKPITRQTF